MPILGLEGQLAQVLVNLIENAFKYSGAEPQVALAIGGSERGAVIEVLEYFDRIGLTHRAGDLRTLLDTRRR